MQTQLKNVDLVTEANLYFDGRCVSHTVLLADGSKKSVGVIFPSQLTFNTGAPEVMELIKGGEQFSVVGNSSFDIETLETLHYICHFG